MNQSEQSFLCSFDADDDTGRVGMTDRNTVILAQLKEK